MGPDPLADNNAVAPPAARPAPRPTGTRDNRRALSLRSRLSILLGIVAAYIAVMLALQLFFQNRLADARDHLIFNLDPATQAVGDLRTAALDQETGIRGYALTGEESFLEPNERGEADADAALAELRSLLDDTPSLRDEVGDVARLLLEWREAVVEPTLDPATAEAATSTAALTAGRARFDDLRAALDVLEDAVDDERRADLDQLDRSFTLVVVVVLLQVAGLIVLGVMIFVALTRQVVQPLARLGDDARQVAEGRIDHHVVGRGAPELVRLGEDVEAMRARIVEELAQLSEARAALEQQTAELVRSNDDLEQFAYVASHDLQEPLRKVSGFTQLLERRYGAGLDDRAKEYIWYANDGARRMQDLINDLLAFSRVGRTTEAFEDVDLAAVTEEVLAVFADRVEAEDATVNVGPLPTVRGDRRLLGQVMQNLVGNALKFRRPEEPPEVDVSCTDEDGMYTITVADNGIGIAPEYADQIFTIFKRLHVKTDYEGTGIGLALAKKVVEFHGGRIWLDASRSPGATFRFSLPHRPSGDSPDADITTETSV
ncbi:MAG TPA: ATP-binding protein [Acidimicrobiales bacterium]|nr:ATP-binding protein [Acidimicrobiales bacterium]